MNENSIVPREPAKSPNYQCTWYAQNYWVGRPGEIPSPGVVTNEASRETLNAHNLLNDEDGWASTYLPRNRSDFYFLIDHGWQTKDETERVPGADVFFSLQVDSVDFPEYAGLPPQEALRRLNQEVVSRGWRGLGLWLRGELTPANAEQFAKWCKYAGVEYWKIDEGDTRLFNAYDAKERFFPKLILEYITGSNGALNTGWEDPGRQSYPSVYDVGGAKQEDALRALRVADVFRTYDCSPFLATTTTIQRTHDILKQTRNKPEFRAVLNLEDEPQVAAGLGCLIGSMRHPNYMERTYRGQDFNHMTGGKRMIQKRINEIERFGRWQRIAPAFPAGSGSYASSDLELRDFYPHTELDLWEGAAYGKTVYQSAPAVTARNMALPKVEVDGDMPYVMASTYPNGPVAIVTEGRVKPEDQWYHPRAKVSIRVSDPPAPIGVFGHYDSLVIHFDGDLAGREKVWAQDLLADEAMDVTAEVTLAGNTLTIPGEVIDRIGTLAASEGDISAPGLVVELRR